MKEGCTPQYNASMRALQKSFEEGWDELGPEDFLKRQMKLEMIVPDPEEEVACEVDGLRGVENVLRSVFGSCGDGMFAAASFFNPHDREDEVDRMPTPAFRRGRDSHIDRHRPEDDVPKVLRPEDVDSMDDNVSALSAHTLDEMAWRRQVRLETPFLQNGTVTFSNPNEKRKKRSRKPFEGWMTPEVGMSHLSGLSGSSDCSFSHRSGVDDDSYRKEREERLDVLTPLFFDAERPKGNHHTKSTRIERLNSDTSSTTTEFSSVWKERDGEAENTGANSPDSSDPRSESRGSLDSSLWSEDTEFSVPERGEKLDLKERGRTRSWDTTSGWGSSMAEI